MPLIFVEGITLADKDFEVIIPMNSILYINNPLKIVRYYKNKDDLICPEDSYININIIELSYIY